MSDKPIIVQGDYYEQKGNFGAGNVSNSEIKGEAKLGGVINEAGQKVEATQQDKKQLYEITISGEFDDINLLDILEIKNELILKLKNKSKLKDSSIKFLDGEEGSIKLVFEGSEEELELLNALIESGEITELGGKTIEKARLIDSQTEVREIRKKVDKRTEIIEEIRSQNVEGRKLAKVDLKLCDLSHIFLRGADLRGVDLRGADLRGADLRGVDLRSADLRDANLKGADFIRALLSSTILSRYILINTNLRDALLSCSIIIVVYLMVANLNRADLRDANVENTIFGDNKGITKSLKQELIKKGAKFEDAPGDRSKVYTRI